MKNKGNKLLLYLLLNILLIVLLRCSKDAVEPKTDVLWTKTFGGNSFDVGKAVQQTTDGGYIITGNTFSFGAGDWDVWLIKTNENGDTLWTKTFGGRDDDEGYAVQQTSDGGYIITGYTYSFGSGGVWLIKTDASGDTLWTRKFKGRGRDCGHDIQQTSDGGYIITGSTMYYGGTSGAFDIDVKLIKTNASGDILWTKTFGGDKDDIGNAIQQTIDGGYIITGSTYFGAGVTDVWLIKTNANGDTLWTKTFGGNSYDEGNAVQQTTDGGYIITGFTLSFGAGEMDVWLIKTNASGDTLWTKTFGGIDNDEGYAVQQTTDGGYIITGSTHLGAPVAGVWLIKTNASGDPLWGKIFRGNNNDEGYAVQQTADGGYIITGYTTSYGAGSGDVLLIKTNGSVRGK